MRQVSWCLCANHRTGRSDLESLTIIPHSTPRGWQHEPSLGEAVPRAQGQRLDHEIRGVSDSQATEAAQAALTRLY